MKNRNTILMMLAACLIGLAGTVSADQIFIEASDDSWVNGNVKDTNYETDTRVVIRHDNDTWGNNYSLFKFDMSTLPANIEVTSVRMRFYTSLSWGVATPMNFSPVAIYSNTQNWDESSVTFNTAPTYDATAAGTLDYFGATWGDKVYFTDTNTITAGGWLEFQSAETVALVQGWADGTIDNFGISMMATEIVDSSRTFQPQTKEHTNPALHPEIIVNYTIIPEPATMGLIGFVSAALLVVRRFFSV